MRIDNFVYLVGGRLQNAPSISSFTQIRFESNKVKRGDLFIALDPNSIQEAITQGAYAILFEGDLPIYDPEIAWIRVKNLKEAAKRLFRYLLIQLETKLFVLEEVAFDLAKDSILDTRVLFSSGSPLEDLKKIVERSYQYVIFKEGDYFSSLALDGQKIEYQHYQIVTPYLFETSFIYMNRYFERAQVPPFLLPKLLPALSIALLEQLEIQPVSKNHFYPIFLDQHFDVVEFGKSDRVLITEPKLYQESRSFLQKKAHWAKILYLSDQKIEGFRECASIEELKEILYNEDFQFALFVGKEFDPAILSKRKNQRTLF